MTNNDKKLEHDVEKIEFMRTGIVKNIELMKKTGEYEAVQADEPEKFSLFEDTAKKTIPYHDKIMQTYKYLAVKRQIAETEKFIERAKKLRQYDIFAQLDWRLVNKEGYDQQKLGQMLDRLNKREYYEAKSAHDPLGVLSSIKETADEQAEFLKDKALDAISNVMQDDALSVLKEKYGSKVTPQTFFKYVWPYAFDQLREYFGPDVPKKAELIFKMQKVAMTIYSSFSQSLEVREAELFVQDWDTRGFERYIKGCIASKAKFEADTMAKKKGFDAADASVKLKEAELKEKENYIASLQKRQTDLEKDIALKEKTWNDWDQKLIHIQTLVDQEREKLKSLQGKTEPTTTISQPEPPAPITAAPQSSEKFFEKREGKKILRIDRKMNKNGKYAVKEQHGNIWVIMKWISESEWKKEKKLAGVE